MKDSPIQRWNRRYESDGKEWLKHSPRKLLLDHSSLLPENGIALDAAAGVAINGVFLAESGMQVIALDISESGLRLARDYADERGIHLDVSVCDLSHLWLPADCFDVIVNFRFLERAALPVYRKALKPGGFLFFETFVRSTSHTLLNHPEHYLEAGELIAAFSGWEIVYHSQANQSPSSSHRSRVVEQMIAMKPE